MDCDWGMYKQSKMKILVLYIVLPLILFTIAQPAMALMQNNNDEIEHANIMTLAKVGLMSRSSSADYYDVYLGAKDAFDTYNDFYGDHSSSLNMPIEIKSAVGSLATISKLKSYLSTTDRVHISSHGEWSSYGPIIDMYGNELTVTNVNYWTAINSNCYVVFLSTCYSLGRGDGDVSTVLANAIKQKTSVRLVLGYSGEVELSAAVFLAMNFWWEHIAGLRVTGSYGGRSGESSFSRARYLLTKAIDDLEDSFGVGASVLGGLIGGWIFGPLGGIAGAVFGELLGDILGNAMSEAAFGEWIQAWEDAYDAFRKVDDGEYVPSLTPVYSGGGKNYVVTID